MLRRILLTLVLTVASASAMAQGVTPTMPKPLADHKARGAQVYYLGKFDALDGWVMIRAGQPEFYYSTPSGNALVMGLLFNGNGDIITTQQMQALPLTKEGGLVDMMASQLPATNQTPPADTSGLPSPPATTPQAVPAAPATATETAPTVTTTANNVTAPAATPPTASMANELVPNTPANQLFLQVQSASSVLYGQEGLPVFYAFVDPNCPHCQQFLRDIEPYVTANKVAVRMLPVGFDKESKQKAAFALGTADGGKRFVAYAKGDHEQLLARDGLSTEGVESNLRIMENWMLNATPIIIYRDKTGMVKLIKGRPADTAAAVKDLTGQ